LRFCHSEMDKRGYYRPEADFFAISSNPFSEDSSLRALRSTRPCAELAECGSSLPSCRRAFKATFTKEADDALAAIFASSFSAASMPAFPDAASSCAAVISVTGDYDIMGNEFGRLEVVPHCSKCGGENLLMLEGILTQSDLTDDSPVTCGDCGAVTTYADLVAATERRTADNLIDGLGGA
jgi:hypothetical protein